MGVYISFSRGHNGYLCTTKTWNDFVKWIKSTGIEDPNNEDVRYRFGLVESLVKHGQVSGNLNGLVTEIVDLLGYQPPSVKEVYEVANELAVRIRHSPWGTDRIRVNGGFTESD